MPNTYLIHAWCIRPFITYLDPVEAETPQEAIALARRQTGKLIDAAEECNGQYPWDEFAAHDKHGNELLRVLDSEACFRNAAPAMRDVLLYVAGELSAFKPDFLRNLGLDVALEQIEKALALVDNTATEAPVAAAEDDHD